MGFEPKTKLENFCQSVIVVGAAIAVCLLAFYIFYLILDIKTKRTVYTVLPDNLICQPFKSEEQREAEAEKLHDMKFKPVMIMDLEKAIKLQSAGKLELISVAEKSCKEHPGQSQSTRASTYYARKI